MHLDKYLTFGQRLSNPGRSKEKPLCLNDDGHLDFHDNDGEYPRNWSYARKWYITLVATFLTMNGNMASSITSGCIDSIVEEFNVAETAANLTTTLFLLGFCAGPFIFAPLSEFYGRRWIFYISFLTYIAFTFLCAFTPTFGGLLVGRLLAGTFVSATLSNAPGVLVDLWESIERGNAMSIFCLASWVGPSLGPIISGFLELKKDWRWSFYVMLMLAAPSALLMFTIPETHAPTILYEKAKSIRKSPGYEHIIAPSEADKPPLLKMYKSALTRPWVLFLDPISLLCNLYLAIVFTLQYMLFSIYPIVFQEMRGWNAGVGQLPLIGTILGAFLGAMIIFLDTRRRKNHWLSGVFLEPEDRLLMAMIGGIGFAVTMFWFAWTSQYNSIPWIVPTAAGGFLSTSLMLLFVAYVNYVTDVYTEYAASVMAVNTFARSIGSASAPLFTSYMFSAMGVNWGGTLIAVMASLLAIIPFVFYKYGMKIRHKSKYAYKSTVSKGDEEARGTHFPTDADGALDAVESQVQYTESQARNN